MTELAEAQQATDDRTAASVNEAVTLHWFDFICPFCYVSERFPTPKRWLAVMAFAERPLGF